MVAVVDDEEHHLPRRDLAENGVRKTDAVEVVIAPALDRGRQPRIHPLPSRQKLSLTTDGLLWRKVLSWWDESAAGSASTRETVAVIIAQLDERPRWPAGSSEAKAENPGRDGESPRHRARRGIQVLKVLGGRPCVADAKHELVRRQRAEEFRDVSFL